MQFVLGNNMKNTNNNEKRLIIDSLKKENYLLSKENERLENALDSKRMNEADKRYTKFAPTLGVFIGVALFFFVLWIVYFFLYMRCKKQLK